MKKWNGMVQVYSECTCDIFPIEVEISDELYARAIECGKREEVLSSDIRQEIRHAIYMKFNIEDYIELDDVIPERSNYDSDEEYQEALEEYENHKEKLDDDYWINDIFVNDPCELIVLNKKFINKRIAEGWASKDAEVKTIEEEIDADENSTIVTYSIDNNGRLVEIVKVFSEVMHSDGLKWGYSIERYPDYYAAESYFKRLVKDYEGE